MIERQFWEDVKEVWIVQASPQIKDVKTGSGGDIDPDLLKEPWNIERIPVEEPGYAGTVQAPLEQEAAAVPVQPEPEPEKPKRPKLDSNKFDSLLEKKTIPDYVEACRLLITCELPDEMNKRYTALAERMPVLQDAIIKFESVYKADLSQFYEYYIPETLQLAATYLEYLDVGIAEQTIQENEKEVLAAADKLLIAVNDKIDEIYKFASMEIKAKAKALESLMSQDGYVDPNFKIN